MWDNGILECTVSLCLDPLDKLDPVVGWNQVLRQASADGAYLANLVMHSWSFTTRAADSGFHTGGNPDCVQHFLDFMQMAPSNVRFVTASEVIALHEAGKIKLPNTRRIADLTRRGTPAGAKAVATAE